jgi:hypothetical protein
MKIRIIVTYLLLIVSQVMFSQMHAYKYKRALSIKENNWYSVTLPDEVFDKIDPNLSGIRIFGITNKNGTLEAPYILSNLEDRSTQSNIPFKLLNESKNDKGYFFTFKSPAETDVNQIKLNFSQQNFDWRLTLEGSQNQQEWFSIVEDYRIISIKNETTDFKFTSINFPTSNYTYYRIAIKADIKPVLLNTELSIYKTKKGSYRNYFFLPNQITIEKGNKQTILSISLPSTVPISDLKISVSDKFDYYRNIDFEEVDSVKTPKGWHYSYNIVSSGTLSSLDKNIFKLNCPPLKKIRIQIFNQDNQPLHIDSIVARAVVYELHTRITVPANYYLVYGNERASIPSYDLEHFIFTMPKEFSRLEVGPESAIEKAEVQRIHPLFENKVWLWLLMVILIIVLGIFSFKMMKNSNA